MSRFIIKVIIVFILTLGCKDNSSSNSEVNAAKSVDNTPVDELSEEKWNDAMRSNTDSEINMEAQAKAEKEVEKVIQQIAENVKNASDKINVKVPGELIIPKTFIVIDQIETDGGFSLSLQTSKEEAETITEKMIGLLKSGTFSDYRVDDIGGMFSIHSAQKLGTNLSYIFTSTPNETGQYLVQYTVIKK